jgi:hypothetical protein
MCAVRTESGTRELGQERVFSGSEQSVGAVHADRLDADAHLAPAGFGCRMLDDS